MAITTKTPVRTVFDGTNAAIGLAEFQTDEVISIAHGGTSGNSISSAKLSLSLTDSNIRSLFSVSGSGSYDNSTGIITVTGGVASVGGATGTVSNAQLVSSVTSAGLLANTSLTGIPLAPTASAGTNTTQIATTAFVTSAVSNLIDSAPGALDTLNELAAAINDDNNFATTIVTQLSNKANTTSLTTANVTEVTNLYFTNSRAILAEIPAVTQLVITTPVFNYNIDSYTGDNPTIYVSAGETISFALNQSGSHPFNIRVSNGGSNFNTGLTHVADNGTITTESSANNKVGGKLFWKVPFSLAGSTYVYQCANHGSMVGNIVIQKPVSTVTTSDISEGSNLYFSNARARTALSAGDGTIIYDPSTGQIRATANITATIENTVNNLTTADVTESAGNLYFSNARVYSNVITIGFATNANVALKANLTDKLNVFSATSSEELRSVITDKTGTGNLVFSISPSFTGTVNVVELAATGNVTSPFFYSQSDINLKKDIEPIVDALDIVKQLSGYSFKWKHNEAKSFGLIAQYVEHILPMLIGTTPDGSKTVLYNGIIALLLEAIKAQQVQIDEIKAKLDE